MPMKLTETIKAIQRATGTEPDGIFGPRSAAAVLRSLEGTRDTAEETRPAEIDTRTLKTLGTLDPKARERFEAFILLAKATAATFGCEYVGISGLRSMDEQAEIYAQGRTAPGKITSWARPGSSWHNYGVAMDFGVFRGKAYLDESEPALARRVHEACAVQAGRCGLRWGGEFRKQDIPHYQDARVGASPAAADKEKFQTKGSVL
jgi:peptidoglycan LD-endopeptidase CwlK